VTKASKYAQIISVLSEKFPSVLKVKLPMFFVDKLDIGKPYDETRPAARACIELAETNPAYDT